MLSSIASSVIAGWLWRRVQELASWATILVPIYLAMPAAMRDDVHAIFSGQGGGLSISAAFGILWFLWTQIQSYRATTVPQAVTSDGKRIVPKKGSAVESQIDEVASGVKPASLRPTLWEQWFGRR